MTLRVSVVVPTYQRPDLLRRCLAALLRQDFRRDAYEIIVVDDGASREVRQLVMRHVRPAGPIVRYLSKGRRRGPAAARNLGWRSAVGDVVAFTDDDCVPDRGWLRAGVAALGGEIAGACGRVVVPLADVPTDYERDAAGLQASEFATANCFYRRAALLGVGGFDERFTAPWREDSDLFFALLESDHHLVYARDAVVVHPVRPAAWGVSIQQQRKNVFNALLYKKHPDLYRLRIQSWPPVQYYLSAAALLLAAAAALAGGARLAGAAAGLWLVLTARFCVFRLRRTSHAPRHVAEMIATSVVIPPLAIYWRLRGAVKYRVLFL